MDRQQLIHSIELSRELLEFTLNLDHPRRTVLGVSSFLFMASECLKERKVTMKLLNAEARAPTSLVRLLVRDLEAGGWVKSVADDGDGRLRVLMPTKEFHEISLSAATHLHEVISSHPLVAEKK